MYNYRDVDLYKKLHQHDPSYGTFSVQYNNRIINHINKVKPKTIIDYGSGKGNLAKCLNQYNIDEYDPAIPGKDHITQKQYDLIISTDVLEHLYIDEIELICKEFCMLNPKSMFHCISTRPAAQILSDGSNAHKTIKSGDWWGMKLEQYTGYRTEVINNPVDISHDSVSIILMYNE